METAKFYQHSETKHRFKTKSVPAEWTEVQKFIMLLSFGLFSFHTSTGNKLSTGGSEHISLISSSGHTELLVSEKY